MHGAIRNSIPISWPPGPKLIMPYVSVNLLPGVTVKYLYQNTSWLLVVSDTVEMMERNIAA